MKISTATKDVWSNKMSFDELNVGLLHIRVIACSGSNATHSTIEGGFVTLAELTLILLKVAFTGPEMNNEHFTVTLTNAV